jgi:hypothetical protein
VSRALRRRTTWLLALAAALVVLGLAATWGHTIVAGDGPEYLMMLESWFRHATPDQRAGDAAALARWLHPMPERVHSGYYVTAEGRWYSYHFWLYSLLGVPFKAVLRVIHGDELDALRWLNVALLVGATRAALVTRSLPRSRRALFVLVAAVSPVLWYVRWPHAEVFVWSAMTFGVLAWDARRWALAAAAFAAAATQSAPLAVFAALAAACAVLEGHRRRAALAVGCAGLAAVPPLFYLLHFGRANLMADAGLIDLRLVGFRRLASFLVDPDLGLVAHAPAALVLGGVGFVAAVRRRAWRAVALGVAALVAMVADGTTVNWNAGSCGLLRYGVYVLPVLAWLAARGLPRGRIAAVSAGAAVAVQAALVPLRFGADDSLFHDALARWIDVHAPALYDPIPEVFVERTLGRPTGTPPWRPLPLPVGFADGAGNVRKLLVDADGLALLPTLYHVQPAYLETLRSRVTGDEPRYFDPPEGAVRVRPGAPSPPLRLAFAENVDLVDGWLPIHHLPTRVFACGRRRATLRLRGPGRVLLVGLYPITDLVGHAVRVTIRRGTRVLEDRPVFDRIARAYTLSGDGDVTIEVSDDAYWVDEGTRVGFCADSLAWRESASRAW